MNLSIDTSAISNASFDSESTFSYNSGSSTISTGSSDSGSPMNKKQNLLLKPIAEFFSDQKNVNRMMSIINGTSSISLRIIDWFVTNYSKKYNITLTLSNKNQFTVYLQYKSQLKSYSKKQFDPFCRRNRIYFPVNASTVIETTIGQLNFFRWAIENSVIDYIETHYKEIEKDMNDCMKNSYSKKKTKTDSANSSVSSEDDEQSPIKTEKMVDKSFAIQPVKPIVESDTDSKTSDSLSKSRKKRHELSISATKTINKHNNVKIVVDFG